MSNVKSIPFTEIIERVQDMSRTNAGQKQLIRGIVNEIYTQDIPAVYDWSWLKANTALVTVAAYTTGVATVTTASATVTFASGAVITTDMLARKIKFADNGFVYDFNYLDSTGGTITPVLSGNSNVTSASYSIFKSIYSLPPDFDRFPVNGGFLYYSGGKPVPLPELIDDDYYAESVASTTSTPDRCRPVGYDTAGNLQYEIIPPPAIAYPIKAEYLRMINPMCETTAGTVVMTSNSTVVSGTNTLFTKATTGDYLRVDVFGNRGNSTWYRIAAIANDTALTLTNVFRTDSSYTGTEYTISATPQCPYSFHNAIIYGSLQKLLPDAKDPMLLLARSEYARIMTSNKIACQSRHAKDNIELIAEEFEYRR